MSHRYLLVVSLQLLLALPFRSWAQEVPTQDCRFAAKILTDNFEDVYDARFEPTGNGVFGNRYRQLDLLRLNVSVARSDEGTDQLLFHLRVESFEDDGPESSTFYFVSFLNHDDGLIHAVRMEVGVPFVTDVVHLNDVIRFFSYIAQPSLTDGETDGRFVTAGSEIPAQASSHFDSNGEITIVVNPKDLGIIGPGSVLSDFNAGTEKSSPTDSLALDLPISTMVDDMPNGGIREGQYVIPDTANCAPPSIRSIESAARSTAGGAPTISFLVAIAALGRRRSRLPPA